MKICIDIRCLSEGRRTGVEEYTINLLANLFEVDKKNEYILFFNSWKKSKADFSWIKKYANVKLKQFHFPNKILNFLFWYFNWPKIDKLVGGADVVFFPNIIFGGISQTVKFILTIHDLSFEQHSEYFSRKRRWWHIFINSKKLCQRADAIIAVSESTKDDLVDLYKIDSAKIETIYSAVSDKFKIIDRNDPKLVAIKEKYSLPYKFILYLGTIEPRKNIIGLVKAFNLLQEWAESKGKEEIQKYKLIIAGEKGWMDKKIFSEIFSSPFREKIRILDFIPDEDKEFVYNLAYLFVYPSFFEGFGFPPLEAMKCGIPVISSNNSSLSEVAGGAAILIDPDKPDEIFLAMKEVLSNPELRENLTQKGLEKSREFDWRRTAQKTLQIFEKLVKK